MIKKLEIIFYFLKYRNITRFKNKKRLKEFQEKKVLKHIKFLQKYSPYFKSLPLELSSLPQMDKKLMMENFDSMTTVKISKDDALSLAMDSEKSRNFKPTINGVTVGLSSGTSDHRGIFIASQKEVNLWTGAILSRALPQKLKKVKIAFFLRANSNIYESVGSRKIQFKYFDIYNSMVENVENLNEFAPEILVAPPSVLVLIGEAIEKKKLILDLKRVISVAEVLDPMDEIRFKKVFDQKIIHQIYQCTEGFLGFTCKAGTIHLNEDIVHIEKEFLDESRFIPIITDFTRKSQPIVRYRLNDVLKVSSKKCPCKSPLLAIENISGREDDVFNFTGTNGEKVTLFPDIIRRALIYIEGIDQYRVVQKSKTTIEVQILARDNVSVETEVLKGFKKIADHFNFSQPEIVFGEYHHNLSRKLKRIENLCKI